MTTRKKEPPWYQAPMIAAMAALTGCLMAVTDLFYEGERCLREWRSRLPAPLPTPEDLDRRTSELAKESEEIGTDLERLADELAKDAEEFEPKSPGAVAPPAENT